MPHLEIERKFLLSHLPPIPRGAEVLRIEQGYLGHESAQYAAPSAQRSLSRGRIRRITFSDGRVVCEHAIKTGSGLVRQEVETEITAEEFAQRWPETLGRRVRKTRYRVRENGAFVWEIDDFADVGLILAEVELPSPDSIAEMPDWLRRCVVKEVTDDPAYTNASIAKRIGQS